MKSITWKFTWIFWSILFNSIIPGNDSNGETELADKSLINQKVESNLTGCLISQLFSQCAHTNWQNESQNRDKLPGMFEWRFNISS